MHVNPRRQIRAQVGKFAATRVARGFQLALMKFTHELAVEAERTRLERTLLPDAERPEASLKQRKYRRAFLNRTLGEADTGEAENGAS